MIASFLMVILVVLCLLAALVYVVAVVLHATVRLLALLYEKPRLVLGTVVLVWLCWLLTKHLGTP